jgi:hypothetical protein
MIDSILPSNNVTLSITEMVVRFSTEKPTPYLMISWLSDTELSVLIYQFIHRIIQNYILVHVFQKFSCCYVRKVCF